MERLCDKIKLLRTKMGLTQLNVAELIGVDRSTYTYYELGKTVPSWDIIKKLAKIFNVSYYDLLEEENKLIASDISASEGSSVLDSLNNLNGSEKNIILSLRLLDGSKRTSALNDIGKILKKYTKD